MSNSQFTFTVLGSSSATPTLFRNQSAHILHYKGINILLDCGEGAQSRMLEYKINQNKIDAVFISHLHPDHFSGLLNYICTQNLFQRTKRLLVFAPEGLEQIIKLQLKSADVIIRYPLEFINLSELLGNKIEVQIPYISYLDIKVFPLSHRIQCFGFKFTRTDEEINLI